MFGSRMVVKKEVELKVARTWQKKLNAIGIQVNLEILGGLDELSLEPMETLVTNADGAVEHLLEPGQMLSPKRNLLLPEDLWPLYRPVPCISQVGDPGNLSAAPAGLATVHSQLAGKAGWNAASRQNIATVVPAARFSSALQGF